MAEVMKVEIVQACRSTGCLEGVSDVIPPMAGRIMKDPRHVLPRP
jgi:hypothetical protein